MHSIAVRTALRVHQQHHMVAAANMRATQLRQQQLRHLQAHVQVGKLSVELLSTLGVSSKANWLLLSVQGQHIRERRKHEAQVIVMTIPAALDQLKYHGRRKGVGNVHTVVGRSGLGRYLLVGIKFVPARRARSSQDEAWVTTAYFVRQKELKRQLKNGELRPYFFGNTLTDFSTVADRLPRLADRGESAG